MWCPRILYLVFLLLHCCVAKQNAVYRASGLELVDLIRGFQPKDGMLRLTKVDGERASLPDGIYFVPEDDALSSPGEPTYLHLNGQQKKTDSDKKLDEVTTSN